MSINLAQPVASKLAKCHRFGGSTKSNRNPNRCDKIEEKSQIRRLDDQKPPKDDHKLTDE